MFPAAAGERMLMEKSKPSRLRRKAIVALAIVLTAQTATAIELSQKEAQRIGQRVWQNECAGTIAGLTSWNEGEKFASLGIGHFIWYPTGARGPFDESFPKFIAFARDRGASLPAWLSERAPCPWNSRAEFRAAQSSPRLLELREFLSRTINLQAQFLVARLESSLPTMVAAANGAKADNVRAQFTRVSGTPGGAYALIDYVNFKGEGVLATERYHGEGWGLLQVLAGMNGTGPESALDEFAHSAKTVLQRRVQNAPPERNESRWLPGWLHRVSSYAK